MPILQKGRSIVVVKDAFRPYRLLLACMILCIVLGNIFPYLTPYFLKNIIDIATTHPDAAMGEYTYALAYIGISLLLSELLYRIGHGIEVYVAPRIFRSTTNSLFAWVLDQSTSYFEQHTSGELNRRIDQVTSTIVYFVENLPWQIGWVGVATATSLVLLASVHWLLAVIFALWLILFIATSYPLLRAQYMRSEAFSATQATLSSGIVDSLANVHTVHVFGAQWHERHTNEQKLDHVFVADTRSRIFGLLNKLQQGISAVILGAALPYAGVYLYIHHAIGIGSFAIIAGVVPSMYGIIWTCGEVCIYAVKNIGNLSNAVAGLSEYSNSIVDGTQECSSAEGTITFDHVTFAYTEPGDTILNDLSCTIPAGQKVGIVGKSGAGKSTLVKLLLRQYEPTHGTISIDQYLIHDLTVLSLRRIITFVPQDTSLFQRTLYDNIAYARPEATQEEVYEAAKHAHANEFIESFPDGYDALVGERGVKLSGGQRQRIALARAMLKNTPILVLDEATSALDGQSEEIVQHGLMELFGDKTVIAIAHRLSTLRAMDRIIVLENGSIIEDGAPHALLANEGSVFRAMWDRQKNGFLE